MLFGISRNISYSTFLNILKSILKLKIDFLLNLKFFYARNTEFCLVQSKLINQKVYFYSSEKLCDDIRENPSPGKSEKRP